MQRLEKTLADYYRLSPFSSTLESVEKNGNESVESHELSDNEDLRNGYPSAISVIQGNHIHDGSGTREIQLPSDFSKAIESLRMERYVSTQDSLKDRFLESHYVRKAFYSVRPYLPDELRRHLQRIFFGGWQKIKFPHWPVDVSVESLHETSLRLRMEAEGYNRLPFIWFWPDGAPCCLLLTHDVETAKGRDFSSTLMDLDLSHGFSASFQVIPEQRYEVPEHFVREIRDRGFELNVHDLNHDGLLFEERSEFLRRAKKINEYVGRYGAQGFRSAVMYRKLDWYDSFEFSYDMSVPNVAHLDPQRGGCCTVMPYFVGKILELPLTTSQDYTIFYILKRFGIELWKDQIEIIRQKSGLISIDTHPDVLLEPRHRSVYQSLLEFLRELVDQQRIWATLPGDVDRWWRARAKMKLTADGTGWKIIGPESHRARLAYASVEGNRVVYSVEDKAATVPSPSTSAS